MKKISIKVILKRNLNFVKLDSTEIPEDVAKTLIEVVAKQSKKRHLETLLKKVRVGVQ